MSSVNVSVDVPGLPTGALVPVELHNLRTHHSVRAVVRTGTPTSVDVDAGPLYVQAVLSDGRLLASDVEVRGTATVVLAPEPGPPVIEPGLSGPLVSPSPDPGDYAVRGDGWSGPGDAHVHTGAWGVPETYGPARPPAERYTGAWARLWVRDGPAWQPAALTPMGLHADGYGLHWRLWRSGQTMSALQVGGDRILHRTTILPPAALLDASLTSVDTDSPGDFGGGYRLTVRTTNEPAEALLAYTSAGQLLAAETIAAGLDTAESMLYSKVVDVLGAIVGGYFLLRTRAVARMHDWPGNLAQRYPWLPDAAVVRIGQLLLSADVSRREVRDLVVQASRAGLPAYTEGLRWLYRATELLLAELPEDADLRGIHRVLRRYADGADWDAVLTSFRGDPVHPTVAQRTGPDEALPNTRLVDRRGWLVDG